MREPLSQTLRRQATHQATRFRNFLTRPRLVVLLVLGLAPAGLAVPEDWPQWGGPNRNFTVPDKGLAASWPEAGPPREWSLPLGPGHSSIAVSRGTVYATFRQNQSEVIVAHNAVNGGFKWSQEVPSRLWSGFDSHFGAGPHSTPLVTGDRLFTVTVRGLVVCLDAGTGDLVWKHDLWSAHEAKPTDRGYAASALTIGELLIVPTAGQGLVALNVADGAVRWQNQDLPNGAFSSPILAEVGDRNQIIAFAGKEVAGLEPKGGRVLWRHPHPTEYNLNAMTPLFGSDGLLFISSAYDGGSRVLQLGGAESKLTIEELWFHRKLQIHHGTAVRVGDTIIGSSGDFGPAFLVGVDARTGDVRFRVRGFSKATILKVGERLLILDETGTLALASIMADGLHIDSRAEVLHSRSWAAPALAGTTLYIRDQKELVALALGPRTSDDSRFGEAALGSDPVR